MRTLVAGLGNIFHGDDGVGVAVAQALEREALPEGAIARDFGIRGVHLAYELLDRYDLVVLVDAVQRGAAPGTVHVLEYADGVPTPGGDTLMDAHDMAPDEVLALVPALGGTLGRVLIVGCEVSSVDPGAELSDPVRACVPEAVQTVLALVRTAHDHAAVTTEIGGR